MTSQQSFSSCKDEYVRLLGNVLIVQYLYLPMHSIRCHTANTDCNVSYQNGELLPSSRQVHIKMTVCSMYHFSHTMILRDSANTDSAPVFYVMHIETCLDKVRFQENVCHYDQSVGNNRHVLMSQKALILCVRESLTQPTWAHESFVTCYCCWFTYIVYQALAYHCQASESCYKLCVGNTGNIVWLYPVNMISCMIANVQYLIHYTNYLAHVL